MDNKKIGGGEVPRVGKKMVDNVNINCENIDKSRGVEGLANG